jgi:hypothetical protein
MKTGPNKKWHTSADQPRCLSWVNRDRAIQYQCRTMSALHQKRTKLGVVGLSAKCQKRTSYVEFEMKEAASVGGI